LRRSPPSHNRQRGVSQLWTATLATLGERTEHLLRLREARNAIAAALEVYMQASQQHYRAYFEGRLRDLDRKIGDLGGHQDG
jgi:hypothetical protein